MSHHGQPEVICVAQTSNRGRPQISIDPVFLEWAYAQRMTLGIIHFLNINRDTVRNALLEYSIAGCQEAPSNFTSTSPGSDNDSGDFLDPKGPLPSNLPTEVQNIGAPSEQLTISFMGPLSGMTVELPTGHLMEHEILHSS